MSETEAIKIVKTIKGLFPTATKEQLEQVGIMLLAYLPSRAMAVIRTHATRHQYLDIPQLNEALRSDDSKHRAGRTRERIVDGLRRLARTEWGIQTYHGMDDEKVLLCHYGNAYAEVRDSGCERLGLDFARTLILDACRTGFSELGKTLAEADELARLVVELGPKEKISSAYFVVEGSVAA